MKPLHTEHPSAVYYSRLNDPLKNLASTPPCMSRWGMGGLPVSVIQKCLCSIKMSSLQFSTVAHFRAVSAGSLNMDPLPSEHHNCRNFEREKKTAGGDKEELENYNKKQSFNLLLPSNQKLNNVVFLELSFSEFI